LEQYLSQPDANLWLIGLDYFYDRYGVAPVDFQPGDFAYDYLGISKYANQSYGDDGGVGVPLVTPAPGQPITGLGDINWQFSTLWYADGFELRSEATPVYLFGGAGYSLAGTPTGVWYHPAGGARVLTYGFDLSLASSFNLIRSHVDSVLQWWEGELTAVKSPVAKLTSVQTSPNPFSDRLEIRLKTTETTPVSVRMYDATGRLVAQIADQEIVPAGDEKVFYWQTTTALPDGVYCCTIQSGRKFSTVKVVKQSR
ncbi:MAG TPA: T9SS type A sorting domain-containing protein, partial [Saprospiraceae bacterium]|nr:T9SS type A sorting domain-containing protein [Saprospiraceae bacterium]